MHVGPPQAADTCYSEREVPVAGKGHMLWKLFNAITLVNYAGREIDQSALVRYLVIKCLFVICAAR